ncbi:MAG: trypsin-like peptidase domain-containing protein [Pirellulaceae bacterium]|nr:trypsin-like peptidase domain-containing protein [Pirellulaceae bacterium]
MPRIIWRCECGAAYEMQEERFGSRVRCRQCGAVSLIEKPSSTKTPPPLPKASVPSMEGRGKRSIAPGNSAEAVTRESKKPELFQRVILVAAISGTGTLVLLLLLVLVFRGGGTPQQQAENAQPSSVAPEMDNPRELPPGKVLGLEDLAELVGPSVVQVNVTGPKNAGTGSGFVLDKQGTIVTNYHVIEDATAGTIVFSDQTSAPIAGYLGVWPEKDIALIRVECSPDKLHPLRLATSRPRQGERVAAFGSPLGLQQSVTDGIVSAIRESEELQAIAPIDIDALLIQTTAPIFPGNSGGPLVDMKGMVVGVNTMGLHGGESLNFAVAIAELPPLLLAKSEIASPLPAIDPIGNPARQLLRRARDHDTEDDTVAEIWDAIRANKAGDALRMLAAVPNDRRGTGYWIASGHVHFRLGSFGDAQAAFGKAVANDPNNTESLLRLALALRFDSSQRSWDAPRDLCKRVIQLDPTNVPAYIICGMCMMPGEDVSYFKTATALDPDSFDAQYNLGIAMSYGREFAKDAWEPLQKALELEKGINLVDYVVRDQLPQPVRHLTRLPTTKSLQVPLKLALAEAYCDGGHYERAIQEYKEVLAIEPDNPVVPWGMCFTYRGYRGDFKHPDALHWERRAEGTDFMPAMLTRSYMPEIKYNYFGMLR